MLLRIAWRNIWRSKIRSLVVIVAVALGLWAGVFMMAFFWGMSSQRMRDIIETKISHVQIHHPGFREDLEIGEVIPNAMGILADLQNDDRVKAASGRIIMSGMLQNTKGAWGVQINGILPESEAALTELPTRIVGGTYLSGDRHNRVLIGDKLMGKLGWKTESGDSVSYKLRKKLVLAFIGSDGETYNTQFRVGGVFKSLDSRFDASNIYVLASDLQAYVGAASNMHEVAFLLNDPAMAEDSTFLQDLAAKYPGLEVLNWKGIAPDLKMVSESFSITVTIFMSVILLALLFGIVNTMMMAILERTRELGMLMAVGMNKTKVFSMIMLETIFLTTVGAPIGLLAAYLSVSYFGKTGIDISAIGEGTAQFGMRSIVYTSIDTSYYLQITFMVVIAALVASVFPARRALRLNPSEAVRAL
ncbi:MAG TPA: ABC transporter permease [Bacteroidetes bacterium]|nr:ABC transporter permease [Bacteroidota bacterium]